MIHGDELPSLDQDFIATGGREDGPVPDPAE
jgi:hypothetical protein